MRRFAWVCVTFVIALFAVNAVIFGTNLVYPNLTVRVPEDYETEPGELVSYGFVITNTGSRSLRIHASLDAEPDWPLLGEAGPIALAAGEEAVVAVSVFVPQDAKAGTEHRLKLTLTGEGIPVPIVATVVTRVKKRFGLNLTGPPTTTAPAGATTVVPFILTNSGNAEDTFYLQVTSSSGWQVSLSFTSATLPPGESRTVECTVKIPGWVSSGFTEEITLSAISATTGQQAQAKTRIKVGRPIGEGRISVGAEEFRLACEFGLSFTSPPSSLEPPGVWLYATGSGKPGEKLELLLAGEEPGERLTLTDYFAFYRKDDYELKLGYFPSDWSGLVLPGTGRMGLEASLPLGGGDFRVMAGSQEGGRGLPWYGLGWRTSRRGWNGEARLLLTETGINTSNAPYLDLSFDRYLLGSFFSADAVLELKENPRSAGYIQYSTPAAPLGWRGGLSWADRINQENSIHTLALGATYNPEKGLFRAGLDLTQGEATATSTASAYLLRQADLQLRLGSRFGATFTAKGIWEESFAWNLGQSNYLLRLSYQERKPTSFLELEAFLSSAEDLANGIPPQYGLSLSGRYRLTPRNSTGVWEIRLEGGIAKTEPARTWNLNNGLLKVGYENKLLKPSLEADYRLSLGYTMVTPEGLLGEAGFNFRLGSDTRVYAGITASPAQFTLRFETVHRFGLGFPRPCATINGLVFQDTDDDGKPGPEEPGIGGIWILLDGKRVGQSGPDGRWSLLGVRPGTHMVGIEPGEEGTVRPRSGPETLRVEPGETAELAFPVWRLTTLTGFLFLDRDGDGFFGDKDTFLPDYRLTLLRPDGAGESTVTAKDGTFLFTESPPGTYELRVEIPPSMADEIETPGPIEVTVAQQGHLSLDLALKPKEKPIIITYMEPPRITVDLIPQAVAPGGTFELVLNSELPMVKIRYQVPGMPAKEMKVSSTEWKGTLAVPPDRPPGPMEIGIEIWWEGGGSEPLRVEARLEITGALRLEAAADPTRAAPGSRIAVSLTANHPLQEAHLLLPWGGSLLLSPWEEKAFGEVTLPEDLLTGGILSFWFSARDEKGMEEKAQAEIVLDPVLLLALLRLHPFGVGASAIKEEFRPVLARLAAILRANPELRLLIIGHADATGKKEVNEILALKRAEAVRKVLVEEYGIDPGRLRTLGKGSAEPIGDNATPEGRALNRRVEFAAE